MIRPISIEAVSNGWIATVGCQRVVYNSVHVMATDLVAYLSNPDEFEKKFLETAVNARHTNRLDQAVPTSDAPPGYPDNIRSAGGDAMPYRNLRDPRHPRSLSEEVNQCSTASPIGEYHGGMISR